MSVLALASAFRDGGVGMWIILVHLLVLVVLAWGWAIAQILSMVLWKRKMTDLEEPAEARDHHGLLDRLRGKKGKDPRGALNDTLSMAAISAREGKPPREVLSRANTMLHHSIAAVHPARGAVTAALLFLCMFAPAVLGAFFRDAGLMQAFRALEQVTPFQRCEFLAQGLHIAAHPARFGFIALVLLAPPALAATFLQLTFLGAKRRRDDILRLVDMLTGVDVRPRAGIVPGIISFVFVLLLTMPACWFISGPPARHLMAPFLIHDCLGLDGGSDVSLPVKGGDPEEDLDGLVVVVTGAGILVDGTLVMDLDDGSLASRDVKRGTIPALSDELLEKRQLSMAFCQRSPDADGCPPDVYLAMNLTTPLETASRVIATCFDAFDDHVLLVLRTRSVQEDPGTLDEMLSEARTFTGMKCKVLCPYRTVKVGDVIMGGQGSGTSNSLLDGSTSSTFGEFVDELDSDTVMVAVPPP